MRGNPPFPSGPPCRNTFKFLWFPREELWVIHQYKKPTSDRLLLVLPPSCDSVLCQPLALQGVYSQTPDVFAPTDMYKEATMKSLWWDQVHCRERPTSWTLGLDVLCDSTKIICSSLLSSPHFQSLLFPGCCEN